MARTPSREITSGHSTTGSKVSGSHLTELCTCDDRCTELSIHTEKNCCLLSRVSVLKKDILYSYCSRFGIKS